MGADRKMFRNDVREHVGWHRKAKRRNLTSEQSDKKIIPWSSHW